MRKTGAVIDLAAILLFVGIGRDAHGHGLSIEGMASTTWPFLAGLVVGWFTLAASRRQGTAVVDGAVVCVSTVTLGMILRLVSGQGSAIAFVFVALGFLGAAMLGWRLVAVGLRSWRRARRTPDRRKA